MSSQNSGNIDEWLNDLKPDQSIWVRKNAIEIISKMTWSSPEVVNALRQVSKYDPDSEIQELARNALEKPVHKMYQSRTTGGSTVLPAHLNEKKCPYCAETIKKDAIVCRYCGKELNPVKVQRISPTTRVKQNPKSQSVSTADVLITIALPIVGLIIAFVYIVKEESRSRGFAVLAISVIAWIVWWFICSITNFF